MPQTEPWTVRRLLEWTTNYLQDHGVQAARLDAEVLLAHARGCERIALYTDFDGVADDRIRSTYRDLVRRRVEGTPVAYLVGRREFYSLSFRVTSDVLIPRPESEFVVITLVDLAKKNHDRDEALTIADVGTGSGNLAICAAREISEARITATDVSEAALTVARQNAADHGVTNRIDFLRCDLLDGVPADKRFDIIISNPPYVSEAELVELAPEVKGHEPHVALVAGTDGTAVIRRLIRQAAERLKPGGWLICEISPMIEANVNHLLAAAGQFERVSTVKDLAQLPRVIVARRDRGDQRVASLN
jgi:release factor glutamine methyltransferase